LLEVVVVVLEMAVEVVREAIVNLLANHCLLELHIQLLLVLEEPEVLNIAAQELTVPILF
jgi:hypothetical protein